MMHAEASSLPNRDIPEKKQTALGLYVTSQEAYEMWKADPEGVSIIDVRTPEEYIFVGHAPMARNIPLGFIEYQWDAEEDEPVVRAQPRVRTSHEGAARAHRHAAS